MALIFLFPTDLAFLVDLPECLLWNADLVRKPSVTWPLFSSSLIFPLSLPCMWFSGLKVKVPKLLWKGQCCFYLLASAHAVPSAFSLVENKDTPQLPSLGSRLTRLSAVGHTLLSATTLPCRNLEYTAPHSDLINLFTHKTHALLKADNIPSSKHRNWRQVCF